MMRPTNTTPATEPPTISGMWVSVSAEMSVVDKTVEVSCVSVVPKRSTTPDKLMKYGLNARISSINRKKNQVLHVDKGGNFEKQ